MVDHNDSSAVARQESVQPSLWDRLVDDLPGLVAETDAMRAELGKELGSVENVDELISGGDRSIERRRDLDDETRMRARRLARMMSRRQFLQENGIVVNADVLREAVRRDIEMLFNIERYEADFLLTPKEAATFENPGDLLEDFPNVKSSVVNYGVPAFAGKLDTSFDNNQLAKELKEVVQNYEPRFKRESVRVKVVTNRKTGMRIEIDGILMLSPVPERLRLSTSVDLDNGNAVTQLEQL